MSEAGQSSDVVAVVIFDCKDKGEKLGGIYTEVAVLSLRMRRLSTASRGTRIDEDRLLLRSIRTCGGIVS